MCGRFTLTSNLEVLLSRFAVAQHILKLTPRYNIAPNQAHPVVIQEQGIRLMNPMRWGLVPNWSKDETRSANLINARAETITEKPSFKGSIKGRRCLIPSDGFYEWRKDKGNKIPMYITVNGNQPHAYAGLWDEWVSPDGSPLHTFTIITTVANDLIKSFHPRMPVILEPQDYSRWLDTKRYSDKEVLGMLKPMNADRMAMRAVSKQVNHVDIDNPTCLNPYEFPIENQGLLFGE